MCVTITTTRTPHRPPFLQEPRPEKKSTPKLAKVNKQYGGPGVFVPSEGSPGHRQQGSGSSYDGHRRDSFPSSILPSNSSMGLDLYNPEYEQTVRARAQPSASVEQLVNDMGELVVFDQRRRDTFPVGLHSSSRSPVPGSPSVPQPMQSGLPTRSVSTSGHTATSSSSSMPFPVSENSVFDTSDSGYMHRAVTSTGQRRHQYSLTSSQSHEIPQYTPAYEPSPSRSSYRTPSRAGPRYSMPATSTGFIPVSSTFDSALHSMRTLGSELSGLTPPPNASHPILGYAPAPTHTPAPTSFTPGPSVSPAPTISTASTSTGSFLSTNLQQSQGLYIPQVGYNPPISASPSSHLPTLPLPIFPTPPQSTPPRVHPGITQPVSGSPHEYISPPVSVPQRTRVVSNHVPGSRPLPPEPQQATQRVPPSTPISANPAYAHLGRAIPFPYGPNQMPPATPDGLPPVPQNPLPIPPGPPGPLGPGSHTPLNTSNAVVSPGSPYRYSTSPSPHSSPSRHSPNLRISDGMAPSNSSLPPSPVPPSGHPRSVSGRPSLPLPPPPPLPAMLSSQQLPFPQLPVPPALPSSQSQQQYLTSSTSAAMQEGQPFYPGPPPRPPTQITDSLQPTSYRQVAH